jgi:hypothetical protein
MAYVKKADRMATATGPSNEQDDAELGIGEEDTPATPDFSALLDNPAFMTALAQRLGGLAVPGSAPAGFGPGFDIFLERMERALGARDEQRPGYAKPLTADEKQSREDGKAKMFALIDDNKRNGEWPRYLTGGEGWQGPSPAGPKRYPAGQEVGWRGPPADDFTPLNRSAAEVYVAYKQWIGEEITIDMALSKATFDPSNPLIPQTALVRTGAEDVQIIDAPIRDMSPRRVMGAGIDPRATHPALRPPGGNGAQAPLGPTYVEAVAA